jgi:hypothetical protein
MQILECVKLSQVEIYSPPRIVVAFFVIAFLVPLNKEKLRREHLANVETGLHTLSHNEFKNPKFPNPQRTRKAAI